ncbi:MAG TPA: glycosyltransferase [Kiritimatiellia bacterium]|nr:glycosyltransferase [Kiritimatiellia bacterium]
MPSISVVMATHNGERYLSQALDSMAAQTYTNWEWVLVDDGSTDNSPEILTLFRKRFPGRVHVLRNEQNRGLTASLNRGLSVARGQFIARMDDDDLAHPERLARQVEAMIKDPDVLLLGTAANRLDEKTGSTSPFMACFDSVRLRINLCWFNPIMHASVMFRRLAPDGSPFRYNEGFTTAQDYELWTRMSGMGKLAVLDIPLMTHRLRAKSITGSRRQHQLDMTREVSEAYTSRLLGDGPLAASSPGDLREWIDDRSLPDILRLKRVRDLFRVVSDVPWLGRSAGQQAFACWAEALLEGQRWTDLWMGDAGRLLRACGWAGAGYLVRRAGRRAMVDGQKTMADG